jgi:hypothetical protein
LFLLQLSDFARIMEEEMNALGNMSVPGALEKATRKRIRIAFSLQNDAV